LLNKTHEWQNTAQLQSISEKVFQKLSIVLQWWWSPVTDYRTN